MQTNTDGTGRCEFCQKPGASGQGGYCQVRALLNA
jgi:hypothetical protein